MNRQLRNSVSWRVDYGAACGYTAKAVITLFSKLVGEIRSPTIWAQTFNPTSSVRENVDNYIQC